ncbi:solute carrier family 22 member 7 [Rhipicephalus microplus]|uniref:solute carrier family 22 member 7 n=1 Tax=Rhipicephalus microplus TaxID=6941 RepID=UPI003F6D843E
MSQRSGSDIPQPAPTLVKMVKGSAKSSVPPSHSADMCRLPGSVGSTSAASRFLTTPRLQDGYMTPSETQVESRSAFGHGRFQKTMLLCAQLATMLAYSYSFTLLFIDLEPVEHWCAPPQQFATLSEQTWKDIAIPRDSNGDFKQCERYEPLDAPASPLAASTSQAGAPAISNLEASTQPPVTIDRTNASEVHCESFAYKPDTPGRNAIARWNLVCDRSWYEELLKAAYTGASVLAIPCVGLASDKFGRRPVLLWASGLVVLSGLATCVASSFVVYALLRCLSSAACSAIEVISFILLFESTQPGPRAPYCALAICWPTVLAPIYVAALAALIKNWVMFNLMVLLPSSLLLVTTGMVEESPHWLLVSLRFEDAERVAVYAARFNDEDTDRVRRRIDAIRQAATINKPGGRAAPLLEAAKRSLAATVVCGGMAYRSFVLSVAWLTLFVVYYGGLATDSKTVSRDYELAKWVVVIGNAPAMAVAYFLVKHYDHLSTIVRLMSTVAMALALHAALVAFELSLPLTVLIMWVKLLLNITYVVFSVETVEMFPTEMRSVGFAGAYMWGRLGATSANAVKDLENQLNGSAKALPVALCALCLSLSSLMLVTLSNEEAPDAAVMALMWNDERQKEPKH